MQIQFLGKKTQKILKIGMKEGRGQSSIFVSVHSATSKLNLQQIFEKNPDGNCLGVLSVK